MKKKEEEFPFQSPVEFYEDLVENPGKCPQIYYNAHDRSMVEIPPFEKRIVVRSRQVRTKWAGRVQIPIEE